MLSPHGEPGSSYSQDFKHCWPSSYLCQCKCRLTLQESPAFAGKPHHAALTWPLQGQESGPALRYPCKLDCNRLNPCRRICVPTESCAAVCPRVWVPLYLLSHSRLRPLLTSLPAYLPASHPSGATINRCHLPAKVLASGPVRLLPPCATGEPANLPKTFP